jgi:hypothetical protein
MASPSKKSGSYSNEKRLVNKRKKQDKRELKLEKRKEWRLKKFADKLVTEVSKTTRKLMKKWTGDVKWNRKDKRL